MSNRPPLKNQFLVYKPKKHCYLMKMTYMPTTQILRTMVYKRLKRTLVLQTVCCYSKLLLYGPLQYRFWNMFRCFNMIYVHNYCINIYLKVGILKSKLRICHLMVSIANLISWKQKIILFIKLISPLSTSMSCFAVKK